MSEFKVGDRVKVIKEGRSIASSNHLGEIGIVTSSAYETTSLDIERKSSDDGFWNDELELYISDWDE